MGAVGPLRWEQDAEILRHGSASPVEEMGAATLPLFQIPTTAPLLRNPPEYMRLSSSHSEPGSAPARHSPKPAGSPQDPTEAARRPWAQGTGRTEPRWLSASAVPSSRSPSACPRLAASHPDVPPQPPSPVSPSRRQPLAAPQPCPHLAVPQRSHVPPHSRRSAAPMLAGAGPPPARAAGCACRVRAEPPCRR